MASLDRIGLTRLALLGLAIALILALVAALVGPYFVDWNRFRPQFEAEASRIMGQPVRVAGALDARLLPTPSRVLHQVAVGGSRGGPARCERASAGRHVTQPVPCNGSGRSRVTNDAAARRRGHRCSNPRGRRSRCRRLDRASASRHWIRRRWLRCRASHVRSLADRAICGSR